jgi:hypothetical protein
MGGVDLQDQVTVCFLTTVKGYRKIFFYLLDNVYFQFLHCTPQDNWKEKKSYADLRINIAQQLLESIKLPDYSV